MHDTAYLALAYWKTVHSYAQAKGVF